ncbi:MAG: Yip1 family protein [Methanoregula sp.]|nr:Yip1 family protein [Methanoregula sp.]
MKNSIFNVLINPDTFYQNVISANENLKLPCMIVLCGAVFGALSAYMLGGITGKLVGALVPGMEIFVAMSAVIGAFIATFLFWIIMTGIFYGMSCLFKGQGSFKRCLAVTGYGYLPQVFGSLITVVVAYLYIPKIVVPAISSAALQDPQMIQSAITTLMHDPAMMEMTQVTAVISIVFLLWSANGWIFGMKHARMLSMRDAAICVGAPVLVYVLYMAYSITGV